MGNHNSNVRAEDVDLYRSHEDKRAIVGNTKSTNFTPNKEGTYYTKIRMGGCTAHRNASTQESIIKIIIVVILMVLKF